MPTLPTNPHYIGDSGHVTDHNTMNTALAAALYSGSSRINTQAGADAFPWVSFTPSWTSLNIGNGTQTWKYHQVGKLVHIVGRTVLGTTSSITGLPNMALPNSFTYSDTSICVRGRAAYGDAGLATYFGTIINNTSSNLLFFYDSVSGGAIRDGSVSATTPFTFGNTDFIQAQIWFEAA